MEYQIKSMLKIGDRGGLFVRVEEFTGRIPDKNYIKGAICWSIGGVAILTEAHWDVIDLLWSFILDGLLQLEQNDAYETCFPAQPLLLRFSKIDPRQVRISIGEFAIAVDLSLMIRSLCEGGRGFFSRMSELLPELKNKWSVNLQKIDKIEKLFFPHSQV
jgi:hypothetical protein